MSKKPIPDGVKEWLDFGLPQRASIQTKPLEDIEGVSIITGIVGNTLDTEVKLFLVDRSIENYLIVSEYPDGDWGSIAIKFEDREDAEEFGELVSQNNASLRLSSGTESGWFLYEAE